VSVMTSIQFVEKLKIVASNYKTLYVMGCFGAPMTAMNKARYNHEYNKQPHRAKMIQAASSNTFGFDCSGLIKGVLWGWSGDVTSNYGGAKYAINGVSDLSANALIKACSEVSTNFVDIEVGEAVWMDGHIGVYIGNGKVVESSPKWSNGVQITNLGNIAKYGNYRIWAKHGRLPYVSYDTWIPKIGDVVDYKGTRHYASADTNKASACKSGKARVTGIYPSGKHPYHLIRTPDSSSTVYGWVDAGSFSRR